MADDKKLYDLSKAIDKRLTKLEGERGSSAIADLALFFAILHTWVYFTYVDLWVYLQGGI